MLTSTKCIFIFAINLFLLKRDVSAQLSSPSPSSYFNQSDNEPSSVATSSWIKDFPYNEECGVPSKAIYKKIKGRFVKTNEFPWLVSLYDDHRKYFCGGSLISDKHVITTAHCCFDKSWFFLEFGTYDLSIDRAPGTLLRLSDRIIIHPEYNANTGHADISLIDMIPKVIFSPKIKPICLWSFPSHDEGQRGVVVGWGNDISGSFSNIPLVADVSIVSDEECKKSTDVYRTIVSNSTFCAGGTYGGPCSGDSGLGFIVEEQNRWYLKGVLSISRTDNATAGSCDVSKFAAYSDLGKYLGWLKEYLI